MNVGSKINHGSSEISLKELSATNAQRFNKINVTNTIYNYDTINICIANAYGHSHSLV